MVPALPAIAVNPGEGQQFLYVLLIEEWHAEYCRLTLMGKPTRPHFYRLKGHKVVPIPGSFEQSVMQYASILRRDRQVADDSGPNWRLSTIFLGMDHNHMALAMNLPIKEHPPLVFETAFFREIEGCQILDRYSTWDEALTGHNRYLTRIKSDSGA